MTMRPRARLHLDGKTDLKQWGLEESEKREVCSDWGDDRFHLTWLLGESTEDWSETRPTPEPNRTEP